MNLMSKSALCTVIWGWAVATIPAVYSQGFSPDDAVKRMTVADGFEVQVVASEPLVRQPVCIEFDDRGRLWVIQYLQYPNPAGLKRLQVDRYSRTKYDRVPEPPPFGPRGADRITILSDSDGDGRMDQGRDFVQGLNLATGLAFGHGGVFVLNVPYLLFYPDRNRDDIPDGDPEVLLTGFGMEDAHSVANSLTWGPDGWLYGCQGSTVTANIRGIEFQQGVWRYHPVSHKFELFCEGGGNSWGLDFNRTGELFYSTNYGGHVLLHGVQGSYLVKSFAKHGALHNPHAYGFFDHAPHQNFRGGHVTVGGIVYQGDSFPESFRDTYIAGDLLGHGVYWHQITGQGSTVKTAHGGELIAANDTWFAPTDVTMGPEGAVYVSDWNDARTAHPDPDADWDRSNGRIYRIAAKGIRAAPSIDFTKLSTDQLLKLHRHRSQWYVRRARTELAGRHDAKSGLLNLLNDPDEIVALEGLWSLAAISEFDEKLGDNLLNSPHPAIRSWAVRLLGDSQQVSPEMAHRLDKFAEREPAVDVRRQLASTAARLTAQQAMPIINANINRDLDSDDPYIPLLWWWAVERHSVTGRDEVMRRFLRPSLWKSRLGRDILLTRLVRRYAVEGTEAGLDCVVQLLKAAPEDTARDALWLPILNGLRDRLGNESGSHQPKLVTEHELVQVVRTRWQAKPSDLTLTSLALTLNIRESFSALIEDAMNRHLDSGRRISLLGMLAEFGKPEIAQPLLELVQSDDPEPVRVAALKALGRFDDAHVTSALIELHQSSISPAMKSQILDVLFGRRSFAKAWLMAVEHGRIAPASVPVEQVKRITLLEDPELDAIVIKHWGQFGRSREDKLAEVRRLNNDLRASAGRVDFGQAVFKKHCAACHQFFGEGTKLGPDLTSANRKDRDFMLISLVDPSSVIRKEFASYIVQTKDGRVLTGLPVTREDASVTLVNAKNEKTIIGMNEIDDLRVSPISLMPDDLYKQLKPQDLRDLFSYLESNQK